ncbi:MAG: DUF3306 domain-containing protein [Azoarcus sp.]|nr:DUF3306 domain-containing protein [Azoarcus sp.]
MMDESRNDIAEQDGGVPFLSRWSRRKLGREVEAPRESEAVPAPVEAEATEAREDDPIDARTGKRRSELSDEDMPDVETLSPDADVSMFFGGQVSQSLRMRALAKVFSNPKYNVWCECAEYAEDYNAFLPMGDIVPHDLKQAIVREADKLYRRLTDKGLRLTPEQAEAHIAAEMRGERVPDLESALAAAQTDETQQGDTDHGMSDVAADEPAGRMPPPDKEAL